MKLQRLFCFAWSCYLASIAAASEKSIDEPQIRLAVERSLSLLENASATTAQLRTCFTCHGQAQPVFALVEAGRRGIHANPENIKRQVEHTYAHLQRGRSQYASGKGQGGQVDTAGYALWMLEEGGRAPDEVTQVVIEYLLEKQTEVGDWPRSSDRPPSEASSFTTTYLALRGLSAFGSADQAERMSAATSLASSWLADATPKETEDSVFRLLAFEYAAVKNDIRLDAITELLGQQRDDGGWAQLKTMDSDAYATATVLYALHRAGIKTDDPAWQRGLNFLVNSQLPDGSWHVTSRSKPFQKYFESGFPHGADQFISTTATAWATLVLLFALPEQESPAILPLEGETPLELPELDSQVNFKS